MFMKVLKKVINYILVVSMIFCCYSAIPVSAAEGSASGKFLTAKTAYLTNIDEYGSNWKSESTTKGAFVVADTSIEQSSSGTTLQIRATVKGDNIIITGIPAGKSENGNIVYFDGSVNNSKYEVVIFSYEKEL